MNEQGTFNYMKSLLPKSCAICEKILTLDDLKAGKIVGNLDAHFSLLSCLEHYSSNGEFSADYQENVEKLAFAVAVEIARAENKLRGHDPEKIGEEVRCKICGRSYRNFLFLGLVKCSGIRKT